MTLGKTLGGAAVRRVLQKRKTSMMSGHFNTKHEGGSYIEIWGKSKLKELR